LLLGEISAVASNSDSMRQAFDRLAADYDRRWRPYIAATLGSVLDAVSLEGSEKVLDVPCGTGELESRLLARWPGLRITGVDISPAMLRKSVAKNRRHAVAWIEADVADLPVADDSFDWVICANSFHYFRRPVESLVELRRVLRPGGQLVLVDWCDDYLVCKLCSFWLRLTDPAFFRTYSLRRCRALLEQAGFEVVRSERFRISRIWGLMRLTCRAAS
jgi:ubiquinone/menaquinone biosynthesis C-methylase UbiE